MVDTDYYSALIDLMGIAKVKGLTAVIVFTPGEDEDCEASSPDMILSTTSDPKVIAACLGNYHVGEPVPIIEESE
jgi:hypothetical protein